MSHASPRLSDHGSMPLDMGSVHVDEKMRTRLGLPGGGAPHELVRQSDQFGEPGPGGPPHHPGRGNLSDCRTGLEVRFP
ncbi:hypothetical protein ASNO1_64410 [Corallococcus caeni]|uniref:Uncharacterized protein n=1 Tax=Corallococcus caeni TaxID=3082388 RepID=A0ABQ6R1T3_9BACT|nr:hypothetical protein ASNO1_64410 [Corallococcus sp. NO1]